MDVPMSRAVPRAPRPPRPTAAELDLLRAIWRLGPSTAREVHYALLAERPELQPATVLRLLQVMHGKGLVVRDESQRSHVYAAAHPQDALQTNLLGELIQKVFAGSGKALVLAALDGHVSDGEREEIRRLLEDAEAAEGPRARGGKGHA
jgi:predicted transcriptional regulator